MDFKNIIIFIKICVLLSYLLLLVEVLDPLFFQFYVGVSISLNAVYDTIFPPAQPLATQKTIFYLGISLNLQLFPSSSLFFLKNVSFEIAFLSFERSFSLTIIYYSSNQFYSYNFACSTSSLSQIFFSLIRSSQLKNPPL